MSHRRVARVAVCFVVALGFAAPSAWAIPPFMKEFQAKYAKADSADEKEKEFAKLLVETTKCNVCHVQGEKKTVRNAYGSELSKILKKDNFSTERLKTEQDKATAEIIAAFETVSAVKSAGDDSPTYGELLAKFQLPVEAPAGQVAKTVEPTPTPDTPAPAPAPAGEPAAPSADAQAAIDAINKIGGTVMQLAQNDDSLVVDFHLGGTALTDDGLAQVKLLPKVVQLDLKDTQITDAGLAHVAGLATLNKLHLEKTKVTDAGLAQLKDLGNLEYLNLYGTAVTDAGLEHLKPLSKLKKVYVWQTQVTDAGIAKLKESLPEVTVVK
jgi:cytochrome c553